MNVKSVFGIILGLSLSHSSLAFKPSYSEILEKKDDIEMFCKQGSNYRKYKICEVFKKQRGKLPKKVSEGGALGKGRKRSDRPEERSESGALEKGKKRSAK
ncbi:MAG: hypothetical protein GY866_33295 [Proteobacteria bacterium]|nr:hypothetical protein [Pseudomonadota bacterium]